MTIKNRPLVEPHDDLRLQKLHVVLLMMLDDFAEVCQKHDICWIGMYGTAIGALRHKGFIPWDDDIDICMPRKDHDRFCEIVERELGDKYTIVNPDTCPSYPLSTTRFVLKGTEFRDANLATMDFDSGIFLDLFPLDNLADNQKKFKKQAWRCWLYNKLAIARDVKHPYIADNGFKSKVLRAGTKCAYALLNLPGVRKINWAQKSLKWSVLYNDMPSQRMGYLCDTNRFGCIYNTDDLLPVKYVSFEDIQMPVAHHAEKLLSEYYGDWKQVPPVSLRREHYPHILDFGDYEPEIEDEAI